MSADFDLMPEAPAAGAGAFSAAPAPYVPAHQTRTVPVDEPEGQPVGEMRAFLAFGGPAVALIAGCWLLWQFGPWLLLGALLLAAIAAVAALRVLAARMRRGRSQQRASRPTRAGPSRGGGGLRGMFRSGGRTSTSGARSSLRPGAGGSPARAGGRTAPRSTTAGSAAVRGAQRRSLMNRTHPGGATSPRAGSTGKMPGGRGSNTGSTGTAGGARTRTGLKSRTAGSSARGGLTRRLLGKTMPGGRGTTGTRKSSSGTVKPAAGTKKMPRSTVRKTKPKTVRTPAGRTTSGRKKIRVSPAAAAAIGRRSAVIRTAAAKKRHTRTRAGSGPVRSRAAKRLARSVRRVATHRKVRSARLRTVRGARRAARAGNRLISPLLVRGFLASGRGLGWAHRKMRRLAASSSGPAWAPRLAGGIARSIETVMNAGMWVAKRRRVQKWMLLHYAMAGIGTPSSLLRTKTPRTRPLDTGHTAKPGPAVRITRPASPTLTTRGATVSTAADEIADLFDQTLTSFEPQSPLQLTEHFEQFAPMLERMSQSLIAHAQRLQDEYEIKGTVVDMLEQFGQGFGGMHDFAEEVVRSWRSEHEEDLTRHEEPRNSEQTFWNYQGGE